MFLLFALIPHMMGQNVTPKFVIRILVPVMNALGLELPQLTDFLLAACTKTTNDNNPPVTVEDKSEVGVEHNLQPIFKVNNSRKLHILYEQLSSLQPGGSDLAHAVSIQNIAASTESLRAAFMNNTNQRRVDAETRNKPTTVGERYPHRLDHILKLCNVESEDDLPVIWHHMAN